MLGILFASIGSLFVEVGASIGKYEVSKKREDIYTMAFLNHLGPILLFLCLLLWQGKFQFSLASLPFWGLQMISEGMHIWLGGKATVVADRSTWGFLRMGTVPLLLIIDAFTGYEIQPLQYVGIGIIVFTLYLLYQKNGFSKKGVFWVIAATINAALAIALYKHAITYYNSVAAHQFVSGIVLLGFITILCRIHRHRHPLALLHNKLMFGQFASFAVGGILDSFAYVFAPASIIVTAKRCAAAFFTVLTGNFYFHEDKLLVKMMALVVLFLGLLFLFFQ